MRWRPVILIVLFGVWLALFAGAFVVARVNAGRTAGSSTPARSIPGSWTSARSIPGPTGGPDTLSCPSPGNCTALYQFQPPSGSHTHGDVRFYAVSEVRGNWGPPRELGGLTPPGLVVVGCSAAGDCLAAISSAAPVVHRETGGVWDAGQTVPGLAALAAGGLSRIWDIACPAAGWCAVAGTYSPPGKYSTGNGAGFVASEAGGAWRPAEPVPGLLGLSHGRWDSIGPIACDRAGSCTLGGAFQDPAVHGFQPFVATETGGEWTGARTIRGAAAFSGADIGLLACPGPGDCSAIASYSPPGEQWNLPVIMTERDGVWGRPALLRGLSQAPIPGNPDRVVSGISCTAPGQCTLAGEFSQYTDGEYSGVSAAVPFVADQVNGVWGAAHPIPGMARLNRYDLAEVNSLSCGSPGNCAVGGAYSTVGVNFFGDGNTHAFLVTETSGTWGRTVSVPGLPRSRGNRGYSQVSFITCWPGGGCQAVGTFGLRRARTFVTTNGR